jgi:diguanylate cyclase
VGEGTDHPAGAAPAGGRPAAEPDRTAEVSQAWARLLERLVRGLEGGSREWTIARRKESLRRVIAANRSDLQRLLARLEPLVGAWELDRAPGTVVETADEEAAGVTGPMALADLPVPPAVAPGAAGAPAAPAAPPAGAKPDTAWPPLVASLESTVRAALPPDEPRAVELADALAVLAARIGDEGATPAVAAEVDALCRRARRLLAHRHHLLDELGALCANLTEGLTELSEDESWARGQADAMRARLADGVNARSVRAVGEVLAETRARQAGVRRERAAARDALRALIPRLLAEVAALEEHTGRFEGDIGRHVQAIESADSLEGLAGVVRVMVDETRAVQQLVRGTRDRLSDESRRAGELQSRVQQLEGELRRLSDEVSVDALTRVANRRGLEAAFAAECERFAREPAPRLGLAIGLLDIDNFKKLNDSLGHAAGDKALSALAQRVRESLRPLDTVARFGGEEFVVLLPGIAAEEAQRVLTRLQRALSKALFMHDQREVFVTFSAGVTAWRPGEPLATALERADEALYEAKRTGKNRTCVA